jgi:hypothetical protein
VITVHWMSCVILGFVAFALGLAIGVYLERTVGGKP